MPGDLIGTGVLVVDVVNPDGNVSNALALKIDRPKARLRLLIPEWTITREMQLILMVLFAGALGSLVHAVKSLADFIGNRTAITSWSWWYVTRPFLGGTLALFFYAVLREVSSRVRPRTSASSARSGRLPSRRWLACSRTSAQKLAEVFDTFFKAEDKRGGKLAAPVIDRLEPPTVRTGTKTPVELKIVGDRLGATRTVKIDGRRGRLTR